MSRSSPAPKGPGLASTCADCIGGRLELDSDPTQMYTYQLRVAIVEVSRDDDGPVKVITVPVGAVLTIATITLESGLVDATWNGQTVSVFVQDLKVRGDLIRTTALLPSDTRWLGHHKFTTVLEINGEHHDRFAFPLDIHQPISVEFNLNFDRTTLGDCYRKLVLVVAGHDSDGGSLQTIACFRHPMPAEP